MRSPRANDEKPTLFIAYTVKGFGLPFAGHKDNHAGLMNPAQIEALRGSLGIPRVRNGRRMPGSVIISPSR